MLDTGDIEREVKIPDFYQIGLGQYANVAFSENIFPKSITYSDPQMIQKWNDCAINNMCT